MDQDVSIRFIPILNPDGFEKTFSEGVHSKDKFFKGALSTEEDIPNRYFRKNGNQVDLNRNFGANWGNDTKTKSLRLQGSDVYQGEHAFSERETQAIRKYVAKTEFQALVDFHCCIGAVLGPPVSGVGELAIAENKRVGDLLVKALSAGGQGVTKTVKNGDGLPGAYEWRTRDAKDKGAGLSSSWGFRDLRIVRTFVVELRGKFVAPCFEIPQLGKEALFALRAMIKDVSRLKLQPVEFLAPPQSTSKVAKPMKRMLTFVVLVSVLVLALLQFIQFQKRRRRA